MQCSPFLMCHSSICHSLYPHKQLCYFLNALHSLLVIHLFVLRHLNSFFCAFILFSLFVLHYSTFRYLYYFFYDLYSLHFSKVYLLFIILSPIGLYFHFSMLYILCFSFVYYLSFVCYITPIVTYLHYFSRICMLCFISLLVLHYIPIR